MKIRSWRLFSYFLEEGGVLLADETHDYIRRPLFLIRSAKNS